jgi:hypothetical protein
MLGKRGSSSARLYGSTVFTIGNVSGANMIYSSGQNAAALINRDPLV